jgi:hypothetical protein
MTTGKAERIKVRAEVQETRDLAPGEVGDQSSKLGNTDYERKITHIF